MVQVGALNILDQLWSTVACFTGKKTRLNQTWKQPTLCLYITQSLVYHLSLPPYTWCYRRLMKFRFQISSCISTHSFTSRASSIFVNFFFSEEPIKRMHLTKLSMAFHFLGKFSPITKAFRELQKWGLCRWHAVTNAVNGVSLSDPLLVTVL